MSTDKVRIAMLQTWNPLVNSIHSIDKKIHTQGSERHKVSPSSRVKGKNSEWVFPGSLKTLPTSNSDQIPIAGSLSLMSKQINALFSFLFLPKSK